MRISLLSFLVCLCQLGLSVAPSAVFAQEPPEDQNGDEVIRVVGFGDSIPYGWGDNNPPGPFIEETSDPGPEFGFLRRVRELANLVTSNQSEPGEFLTNGGVERFPSALRISNGDYVGILEGSNDASFRASPEEYRRGLQQMINVAVATGVQPILMTIPPPCCERADRAQFTRGFSSIVRERAALNETPLADVERAWASTCMSRDCELYNVPEGLHPNTRGHNVIGQVFLATLFGIDIFAADGAALLEEALGLEAGTVIVVSDDPNAGLEEEAPAEEESSENEQASGEEASAEVESEISATEADQEV